MLLYVLSFINNFSCNLSLVCETTSNTMIYGLVYMEGVIDANALHKKFRLSSICGLQEIWSRIEHILKYK